MPDRPEKYKNHNNFIRHARENTPFLYHDEATCMRVSGSGEVLRAVLRGAAEGALSAAVLEPYPEERSPRAYIVPDRDALAYIMGDSVLSQARYDACVFCHDEDYLFSPWDDEPSCRPMWAVRKDVPPEDFLAVLDETATLWDFTSGHSGAELQAGWDDGLTPRECFLAACGKAKAYCLGKARFPMPWAKVRVSDRTDFTLDEADRDGRKFLDTLYGCLCEYVLHGKCDTAPLTSREWLPSLTIAYEMAARAVRLHGFREEEDATLAQRGTEILRRLADALFPPDGPRNRRLHAAFLRCAAAYLACLYASDRSVSMAKPPAWTKDFLPYAGVWHTLSASMGGFRSLLMYSLGKSLVNPVKTFTKDRDTGGRGLFGFPHDRGEYAKLLEATVVDLCHYWDDHPRRDAVSVAVGALAEHAPDSSAFHAMKEAYKNMEMKELPALAAEDASLLAGAFLDLPEPEGNEGSETIASCSGLVNVLLMMSMAPYAEKWMAKSKKKDCSPAELSGIMYIMHDNEKEKMRKMEGSPGWFADFLTWNEEPDGALSLSMPADMRIPGRVRKEE